jgi:magnesium-transporting ATPase (P-type)
MAQKIQLFFLVLSVIFCLQYILRIVYLVKQDNPEPMKIGSVEKIFLYIASSYIVTSIITAITL